MKTNFKYKTPYIDIHPILYKQIIYHALKSMGHNCVDIKVKVLFNHQNNSKSHMDRKTCLSLTNGFMEDIYHEDNDYQLLTETPYYNIEISLN